jgi:hypothetical protein
MPYDAASSPEVTARDRMIRLRDFLAALPDGRFAMSTTGIANYETHECSSAACMCGWAQALFYDRYRTPEEVGADMGLTLDQSARLFRLPSIAGMSLSDPRFAPDMWAIRATRSQAVRVLDHYLATGQIDWRMA